MNRYCCCCPSPENPTKETWEMGDASVSMVTSNSGGHQEEIKVRSRMKTMKIDEEWDIVMKENDTAIREDHLKVIRNIDLFTF